MFFKLKQCASIYRALFLQCIFTFFSEEYRNLNFEFFTTAMKPSWCQNCLSGQTKMSRTKFWTNFLVFTLILRLGSSNNSEISSIKPTISQSNSDNSSKSDNSSASVDNFLNCRDEEDFCWPKCCYANQVTILQNVSWMWLWQSEMIRGHSNNMWHSWGRGYWTVSPKVTRGREMVSP